MSRSKPGRGCARTPFRTPDELSFIPLGRRWEAGVSERLAASLLRHRKSQSESGCHRARSRAKAGSKTEPQRCCLNPQIQPSPRPEVTDCKRGRTPCPVCKAAASRRTLEFSRSREWVCSSARFSLGSATGLALANAVAADVTRERLGKRGCAGRLSQPGRRRASEQVQLHYYESHTRLDITVKRSLGANTGATS